MQLNLPIMEQLSAAETVLIAGAGGGFDIYAGLPLYFALQAQGKSVHLANFSFSSIELAKHISDYVEEIPALLMGVRGKVKKDVLSYYPEGYLADWFAQRGDDVMVWMFERPGPAPLLMIYKHLVQKLKIDAIILVDGGVDSLMRGDEAAPGTLIEDSVTLAAVSQLEEPTIKILACLGFGTEVEERVNHYLALENMAALSKIGAFLGSCSLIPQMEPFKRYEEACRHAWEGAQDRRKSHISTRVIPAAHGEFGDFRMYGGSPTRVFISPLMSIYWFYDAQKVAQRSMVVPVIKDEMTLDDTFRRFAKWVYAQDDMRRAKTIPY